MKKFVLVSAAIMGLVGVVAAPASVLAANAKQPYHNVNHANDKGNNSGDAETAKLNQQQLDQAKAAK